MAFKLFELYGEPSSKAKYNTEAIVKVPWGKIIELVVL